MDEREDKIEEKRMNEEGMKKNHVFVSEKNSTVPIVIGMFISSVYFLIVYLTDYLKWMDGDIELSLLIALPFFIPLILDYLYNKSFKRAIISGLLSFIICIVIFTFTVLSTSDAFTR